MIALGRWGSVAPMPPGEMRIGVDSTVLALKTLFDPAAAGGLGAATSCAWTASASSARVATGSWSSRAGAAEEPDAVIETDPVTLAAADLAGLLARRRGALRERKVEGHRAALERLLRLFPLPVSRSLTGRLTGRPRRG